MAEQDGGMVGEIDAGLTLSRDIRFEDLLCQNPFVQNLYDHLCDWKTMLITIATRRACHLLEKLQKSKYCGEVPATKLAALQKVAFPCHHRPFYLAARDHVEHIQSPFFVHHHHLHPIIVSIPSCPIMFNSIWFIITICIIF